MYNNQTKTVKVGGYTFFYVYDFMPPDIVESMVKCVEVDTNNGDHDNAWEIKRSKKYIEGMSYDAWREWSKMLGVTEDLPMDFLQKQNFWLYYYNKLEYYVNQYIKEGGLEFPGLEWASTWFIRAKDIKQEGFLKFHRPYDESGKIYVDKQHHTHVKTHVIGCVYYLKSPSPDYGTAMEFDGHKFISPGLENSLLIFDPRLPHSRTLPPAELSNYPRHAVITDFKVEERLGNLTSILTEVREAGVVRRWKKLVQDKLKTSSSTLSSSALSGAIVEWIDMYEDAFSAKLPEALVKSAILDKHPSSKNL